MQLSFALSILMMASASAFAPAAFMPKTTVQSSSLNMG